MICFVRGLGFAALLGLSALPPASAQDDKPLTFIIPTFSRESLDIGQAGTGDLIYLGNIFDPIIGTDPGGQLSPKRGLAESWTVSPDGKGLAIKLRDGVRWHDGQPLTTDDILFTLHRWAEPDATCTACRYLQSSAGRPREPWRWPRNSTTARAGTSSPTPARRPATCRRA